jgi:hypothetical protein
MDIELVDDKSGKLKNKLFMKKLELLLEEDANILYRCAYCNALFTCDQELVLRCKNARIFVDFHGQVIAKHVKDRNWNLNQFINYLHTVCKLPWRNLYWKLWGYTVVSYCMACDQHYRLAELMHCYYHPANPVFAHGSNKGLYLPQLLE